jgi:cold shock CspA family protein
MTLQNDKIAYNGKYFLGAIKFFDNNKDFGFIASNHCGMPLHSAYKQDFYVNSNSFAEEEAKVEGKIVVFQILEQDKGRKKAINVRRYSSTSNEDVQLALSYYGNYEKVEFKDKHMFNIYCHCHIPLQLEANKVADIILKDKKRSPKTTFKHFYFFIKHYKTGYSIKEKYIYDRDFDKDKKQIWINFFSIFTTEEWLEILKEFPSACRYVTDESILLLWIDYMDFWNTKEYISFLINGRNSKPLSRRKHLSEITDYWANAELLPDNIKQKYTKKIQQIIDIIASDIIKKMIEDDHVHADLYKTLEFVLNYTPNKHEDGLKKIEEIHAFEEFKSSVFCYLNNPQEYLNDLLYKIRESDIDIFFGGYDLEKYDKLTNSISNYFEGLDSSKRLEAVEKIQPDITVFLNIFLGDKNLQAVVGALTFFNFLDKDYKKKYLERLYSLVKEKLCCDVQDAINEKKGLPDSYIRSYTFLTSQFDEETKKSLHSDILSVMRTANNIELISNCSAGEDNEWLSKEEAHTMADAIVKDWKYNDFINFFNHKFRCKEDLRLLIANYAFNLISQFSLSENFDGSPTDDILQNNKSAELENIRFLEHIIEILPDGKNNELWQTYISERSKTDLLALYDHGLASTLPITIIKDVINGITLNSVLANNKRWYNRPILHDDRIKDMLVNANDDLFTAIAVRLEGMSLTDEEIPLAILLIELMKINKPSNIEGWKERNWENAFAQKIKAFRASLPNDSKLPILLWAVHFQSSGSMALLRDIFHLLPPYIQIRVVKKLFCAIAAGKFKQTAATLYEVIGGNIHQICFPLEIIFTYLKLREKDPSAELNNNIMLQLLDGREDHSEWIGIRQFVTECHGRIYKQYDNNQSWRQHYYNGAIWPNNNGGIVVFVPEKMISENNTLQNYNNKYKATVNELISITYKPSEYSMQTNSYGTYYIFEEKREMELYTLSRYFNFRYKDVNSALTFIKLNEYTEDPFCECRMSDEYDKNHNIPFYWCGNKPCFCHPTRFHTASEWESYTLLDLMHILGIPTDYTTQKGKVIRFGYYTIVSSYLKSFAKFYEHLKCRHCGKLMKPNEIANFTSRAVNEFSCDNSNCTNRGAVVYLNHCFNRPKCNATIDSRDSKKCPNGQYICPECGACCSTKIFRERIEHLETTGGEISQRLYYFVTNNLGHWEQGKRFCFKCGKPIQNGLICAECKQDTSDLDLPAF